MKRILILLALVVTSCSERTTEATVTAINGTDGTSCSVAPEYARNESDGEYSALSIEQIGATISCTDGTFATIYNGERGAQGPQGDQGIQGPQGEAGKSCQAYRTKKSKGVTLKCPGQKDLLISDGTNGTSCSSARLKGKVKITCGKTVSYIYDGVNGANGTSCVVNEAKGGANVTCGDSTVYIANGTDGTNGLNGLNGESAVKPGLLCNVHNLNSWDKKTSLPEVLANNAPVGSFVLNNLSVPDSPSSGGFPGMPAALQTLVGLEGYALDCNGYLNIKTSGLHTLDLLSDDGVKLSIEDDFMMMEDQGLHAPRTVSITKNLYRGQNKINVLYFQGPHTQIALELKMTGPNTPKSVVPTTEFTH